MTKKIISVLCALMICITLVQPSFAAAPDLSRPCRLTLLYSRGEKAFDGLEIDIFRVAGLKSDGSYQLIPPFSAYPVKIHGITSQQQWQSTAQTVKNYVIANNLTPYRSRTTDAEGYAVFDDLEAGLYMVSGITTDNVIFNDFMIYLPVPLANGYDYDVEAKPKSAEYTPPASYTVLKLWNDGGIAYGRPASVSVDILKDGAVYESVTLSGENNWSYTWEISDSESQWSVMETQVPDGYKVSISQTETAFIITNSVDVPDIPIDPDDNPDPPDDPEPTDPTESTDPTEPTEPTEPTDPTEPTEPTEPTDPTEPAEPPVDIPDDPEPPKSDSPYTGDTSPLLFYVVMLCISGFGLMIMGVWGLRDRRYEKKQ